MRYIAFLLGVGVFAQAPPKENIHNLNKLQLLAVENASLKLELLNRQMNDLRGEFEKVRLEACSDAKIPAEKCVFTPDGKAITESAPPISSPPKNEGGKK